ncbi:Membrane-associated protein tcaA [Moritella viscosa]|nr:Membrane-associated protein tcaA [Moritella viscosa]
MKKLRTIKKTLTLVTTCPACGERAYDDGSCQVCGHSH